MEERRKRHSFIELFLLKREVLIDWRWLTGFLITAISGYTYLVISLSNNYKEIMDAVIDFKEYAKKQGDMEIQLKYHDFMIKDLYGKTTVLEKRADLHEKLIGSIDKRK